MFSNQRFASLSHGQSPASRLVLATAFFVAMSALTSTGRAADDFVLTDSQHLDVTSVYSTGILYDSSTADVSGQILEAYVNDNASLRLHSGVINRFLYANDTSKVTISGGSVGGLLAYDDATVDVGGGKINWLKVYGTSTVNITGGEVPVDNILFRSHPQYGDLYAYDGSTVNVSGGTVAGDLFANGNSTVNITGGTVGGDTYPKDGDLYAYGGSTVNVSGGTVAGDLFARDSSTVTFYGYDFRGAGGLSLEGETVLGTGLLTGKWFDDDTTWIVNISNNPPGATIRAVVPEPSTFTLAAFGLLGLLAWGRRRKGAVSPRA